ncbi:hypothetical protein [Maridesulfovibrio ferrireducens]|uniref:hypothetical protein n=1 Tax=Maridesulfovibrio ferrireducens TaxID=246191 RepID=UPI001A1F9FAA|nr:hypothetical protein [Maridesulfovibrio ferrireducens]MBI9110343.1 hypothetical protein [Maridesulfovibrio ferrireducens]
MIDKNFVEWLASGRRGLSSNTLATRLSGINCCGSWGSRYPSDPSDFIRCQKLLDVVPGFRERLGEMREESPEWAGLVDSWDVIANLIELDLADTPEVCPRAYKKMKSILEGVRLRGH